MAVEWAPDGIRVNAVAPGYVDTPLVSEARARGDLPVDPVTLHALGRLANADEIALPVLFLLGDGASFITGETLMVDGGYRIHRSG
jgi:NAD(P)-dependent dehydrogenase (short-subunit alcohol dehydrogenase family)